jgi:hypothetical protein
MGNNLLSVVIPSADPRFLKATVDDVFAKAAGPVEVIVSADGHDPHLPARKGLTVLVHPRCGMRGSLNAARPAVRGDWYMKTDEHCLFAEGFDEQLKADCDGDWLLIPRRHSLDPERWCVEDNPKGPRDYHSLSCPVWSIREKDDYSMQGLEWPDRTRARLNQPAYDVDETMSWQGSCYFMARRHYEWLGPLQEAGYGGFAQEPQEIGNKTWLGGGKLMVTKRTWYAHLHKGKKYGRGYRPNRTEIAAGHEWGAWYWMTDQWAERAHDMRWLVERFWPVPTWPADVLERWGDYFPKGATLAQLKAAALRGQPQKVV